MVEANSDHLKNRNEEGLSSPEESPTIKIESQIDRVMTAFLSPEQNPVDELHQLDMLFIDGGQPQPIVESTARRLFQQPSAFDNLNFQSSLITNGSTFFGAVLQKMGDLVDREPELAEDAALPVQIRLVEHNRRGENEKEMSRYVSMVEVALRDRLQKDETTALAQLAKVRYEQSMMHFSKGEFEQAIAKGEESIDLCKRAEDEYGVLTARGNTAGLFSYEWARTLKGGEKFDPLLEKGKVILEQDLTTAQSEMAHAENGSLLEQSFTRVEMNNAAHLMKIAQLKRDVDLARKMMAVLQNNAVYVSAFDPEFPGNLDRAQEWVRPYTVILDELEEEASQQ